MYVYLVRVILFYIKCVKTVGVQLCMSIHTHTHRNILNICKSSIASKIFSELSELVSWGLVYVCSRFVTWYLNVIRCKFTGAVFLCVHFINFIKTLKHFSQMCQLKPSSPNGGYHNCQNFLQVCAIWESWICKVIILGLVLACCRVFRYCLVSPEKMWMFPKSGWLMKCYLDSVLCWVH